MRAAWTVRLLAGQGAQDFALACDFRVDELMTPRSHRLWIEWRPRLHAVAELYNLSSFSIVEAIRRGAHPKDAGMTALRQVVDDTISQALSNARGGPNFNVKFYIVNAAGEYAGVALYGGDAVQFAVRTENGAQLRRSEALIDKGGQFSD